MPANLVEMIAPMRRMSSWESLPNKLRAAASPGGAGGIVGALVLVTAITATLEVIKTFVELPPIIITYLIPVLIAALRWGFVPALVATVSGAACAAFFFYRPIHTFYVEDPARRLGILIFAIGAVVAAHLGVRMRREAENVRRREKEIGDLYVFSRRLAGGHSTADIFDAIQQHLATVVGRKVALFEPRGPAGRPEPIGGSDGPADRR